MLSGRQATGRRAEELAAQFLRAQGLQILQRNYRRRLGELDIVARGPEVLVVVEVRSRASDAFGGAAASVGWRKLDASRAPRSRCCNNSLSWRACRCASMS